MHGYENVTSNLKVASFHSWTMFLFPLSECRYNKQTEVKKLKVTYESQNTHSSLPETLLVLQCVESL